MSRHIDKLRELTETSNLAGSLTSGTGRYSRTPDYTKAASRSSRPSSDRGTTFHFAHKAMSKRNDMSDANHTHTTSAAHQGYIERPSATEEISKEVFDLLDQNPQTAVEDGLLSSGFAYPHRVVDPTRASFGTLGATKAERKEFWNEIERNEGKNARVQNRIIAELPHEFNLTERCMAARDFCQSLEERALPYWATIHAPGKRNDHRNYHLHITYFDRPSGRRQDGEWSHNIVEVQRKKSRHLVRTRPYRSNKHPDTRARDWPKRLRRNYSDTCNFYLSVGNYEKRYDPRPYRESGIAKEPTEHLGNKISALESMGLDTTSGQRNAKREMRWKISKAEQPWKERQDALVSSEAFGSTSQEDRQERLSILINQGTKLARKSASLSIISEMIETRVVDRQAFLDQEITRLSRKDDLSDLAATSTIILALTVERDLLEERSPGLQNTAKKCAKMSREEMKASREKMKMFDIEMKFFDPEAILDSETMSALEDIDVLTEEDNVVGPLTPDDMDSIDDLFGPSPGDDHSRSLATTQSEGKGLTQLNSRPENDQESPTHPPDLKPEEGSKDETSFARLEDILGRIASDDEQELAEFQDKFDREAFPGAWMIQPTREREELEKLDRDLATLDNRQLRQAAIASRDATDLCSNDMARDEYGRGWAVLRHEAARRGLDLDTGIHAPEVATDPDRATLHVDQDPSPIRVVRKNIARQRVRV